MAVSTEEIYSTLNDLIQTCKDGEEGFNAAAEGVKNSELRTIFQQYASQRAKFAQELQLEVARLGGKPEKSGTIAGAAHRGWMNLKATVTARDDAAMVAECEKGEDAALESYEKAAGKDLPSDLREVIERQYHQIQEAYNRIRRLELRMASGHGYP